MPEPDFPLRNDLEHFDRVSFMPDPRSPIDRWFQVPDGRSVEELAFLIGQCRERYDVQDLRLVADPLAGAGSAAVAAADSGLGFLGFERDPPRALFALAKSVAVAGAPIAAGDVTSWLPTVQTFRGKTAEVDPFANPAAVIAAALTVALLAPESLSPVDDRLMLIHQDLEELTSRPQLDYLAVRSDVFCGDSTNVKPTTICSDLPPAVIITSPPHPRSRARWAPDDGEASVLARRSMETFGRWAHNSESRSAGLGPIDGVFRLAQALPSTRLIILECETPNGADDTDVAYAAAARRAGYQVEEYVATYLAAPDEPQRGRGGYLVLRPPTPD